MKLHPLTPAGTDVQVLNLWDDYFSKKQLVKQLNIGLQEKRDARRDVEYHELQSIQTIKKEIAEREKSIRYAIELLLQVTTDIDEVWTAPSEKEETIDDLFEEQEEDVSNFFGDLNAIDDAVGFLRQPLMERFGRGLCGLPNMRLPEHLAALMPHPRFQIHLEHSMLWFHYSNMRRTRKKNGLKPEEDKAMIKKMNAHIGAMQRRDEYSYYSRSLEVRMKPESERVQSDIAFERKNVVEWLLQEPDMGKFWKNIWYRMTLRKHRLLPELLQ